MLHFKANANGRPILPLDFNLALKQVEFGVNGMLVKSLLNKISGVLGTKHHLMAECPVVKFETIHVELERTCDGLFFFLALSCPLDRANPSYAYA